MERRRSEHFSVEGKERDQDITMGEDTIRGGRVDLGRRKECSGEGDDDRREKQKGIWCW